MTFHVLVPDSVNKKAVEILEQAGLKVTAPGQMKREETLAAIADADALIIRSATKADAALINASTKLKAIARAGVGVDNVDLDAASAKKIAVMNTPAGNTVATAEFAFGLMLALVFCFYPVRQILVQMLLLGGGFSFRNGRLDHEIANDANVGAGLLEAFGYFAAALVITRIF